MKPPVEGIRASDAEREQIATLLQAAAGDGRLTPDEAGERLAEASSARYRDDLERLVADLPAVVPAAPRGRAPLGAFWLVGSVIRAAAFVGLLMLAWRFAFWPGWLFAMFLVIALTRARYRWRTRRHRWAMRRGPGWVAVVR
jgi:hypothetical protein